MRTSCKLSKWCNVRLHRGYKGALSLGLVEAVEAVEAVAVVAREKVDDDDDEPVSLSQEKKALFNVFRFYVGIRYLCYPPFLGFSVIFFFLFYGVQQHMCCSSWRLVDRGPPSSIDPQCIQYHASVLSSSSILKVSST